MGNLIVIIINVFFVIRLANSAAMCVLGYKWRKGLIAIASLNLGLILGFLTVIFFVETVDLDIEVSLLISALVPILFFILAYKCIWLNHFLTGFLVFTKLSFMIIYRLMSERVVDFDMELLIIISLSLGILAGLIISIACVNFAVLFCVVYIGTVDLVLSVSEIINNALFVATSDISFVFDPEDLFLKIIGIEIPSAIEVIFIVIVGVASFIGQKLWLDKQGIKLSSCIIDDRKKSLL